MPTKEPGDPVEYVSSNDLFRRVLLVDENVYAFVPDNRDPDAVLESFRRRIRDMIGVH
jgi:hypothetical protein